MADPKKDDKEQPAAKDDDLLAGLGISAPPVLAGGTRQPVGMPAGFFTQQAIARPDLAGFQPFLQGDEYTPGYMPPEDRARIQAKMAATGLYGSTSYSPGVWSTSDANAFQQVLEYANAAGISNPEQALDDFAEQQRIRGPRVQGPRAPLVSRVTDPNAVRATLRETALSLTGSRLSDDDEKRIIAAYQSYQQGLNQAAYAAGENTGLTTGPGGTVATPMDMKTFAEQQVEQTDPLGTAVQRAGDAFDRMLQSLNPVTSVAPVAKATFGGLPNPGGQG